MYQHGKTCNGLFTHSNNPVFSRYFHSISCHSPLLLRIISLRSVNTEMQERLFGQAKQITKGTSSLKPNHVISNFLIRMHEENKVRSMDPLAVQEGEIHKLAQMLGPPVNTVIPHSWMATNPTLHQAHLERVSDFLLAGPGVWWRQTQDGIEFLDGYNSPSQHPEGPDIHHVRSTSLPDIDIYLHHKWEECCMKHITMPAHHIRHYCSDGSLSTITAQPLTTASNIENPISITSTNSEANTSVQANTGIYSLFTPQPNTETSSTESNKSPAQCEITIPNTRREISIINDITPTFVLSDQCDGNCNKMPQLPVPSTPPPSPPSPPVLQTTLAKTISQVIPTDSTLQRFDLLRSKVKQTRQKGETTHLLHLSTLSQKVKEALISTCKELSTTIANWKHTQKGNTKEIQDAAHKLNIARKVLKHEWKTTIDI